MEDLDQYKCLVYFEEVTLTSGITWHDVTLYVRYYHIPEEPPSFDSPGNEESADITQISLMGGSRDTLDGVIYARHEVITDQLSPEFLAKLEKLILKADCSMPDYRDEEGAEL